MKRVALAVLTVVLAVTAVRLLVSETGRLLFELPVVTPWLGLLRVSWTADTQSALDLKTFLGLVQDWFAGVPVYRVGSRSSAAHLSTYPPASHLILWPLFGWTSVTAARWLYGAVTITALATLVRRLVRESRATSGQERMFVSAAVLSAAALGQTIGNGQLGILVMAALVTASRPGGSTYTRGTFAREAVTVALVTASLMKPNIAAPFFLVFLLGPNGLWRGLATAGAYAGLTAVAALFQPDATVVLVKDWLSRSMAMSSWHGGDNVQYWLAQLGAGGAAHVVSMAALGLLAGWLFANRHIDSWFRLSVTAIVARFWVYHSWYDDLLLLVPLAALYRIARDPREADATKWTAGVLFALTLASLVALHAFRGFRQHGATIWIGVLAFLLWYAEVRLRRVQTRGLA